MLPHVLKKQSSQASGAKLVAGELHLRLQILCMKDSQIFHILSLLAEECPQLMAAVTSVWASAAEILLTP